MKREETENLRGEHISKHLGRVANYRKLKKCNFNERKMQAPEIFTHYTELRPPAWAVVAVFFPTRASFSYLLRLHRMGLLRRRRDWRKRIVYQLSPHGARWLFPYSDR